MKTADAIWAGLSEGLDELFEMVRFEKTDQSYEIWLDEKIKLSDEDFRNHNIVARGHTDYVTFRITPCEDVLCICTCARTNGGTKRPTRYSATILSFPMRKAHDSAPSSWLLKSMIESPKHDAWRMASIRLKNTKSI